jgi:ubiquinone/menaquinone biosynthesis C-methylase UbiE
LDEHIKFISIKPRKRMETKQDKPGNDSGQVSTDAAKVYEEFFVPALFREWAPRVAKAAYINAGDRVLDVACGTGVLARYIDQEVNPGGQVTGVDLNEGMLAVASGLSSKIRWDKGNAESLPYDNDSFDAVVSQFGLMFFDDRSKSIQEMLRVLKPGKHLAVAVWDTLDSSPGYGALTELLKQQFGDQVADKLRAPFALGDKQELLTLFHNAGIRTPQITTTMGLARFPSVRAWIYTDVRGWVMSELVSDEQLERLVVVAGEELSRFTGSDGKVQFGMSAHIVTATKERIT